MLTPEQKMELLTQAGVKADDAQELVLGAPDTVIEEETDERLSAHVVADRISEESYDDTLKRIIAKAYADKDKAMSLCDAEGKTQFDTRKVSKVQAAARGLDKTAHNKRAWDDSQKMVATLKRMVRDHYRVGSVKAKIAASKNALPQAVRDLTDDNLERLLASEQFLALVRDMEGD